MNNTLVSNCVRLAKNLVGDLFKNCNWKHFSFACRRTTICGVGWNKPKKSHPLAYRYGYKFSNLHSELDCVIKLDAKPSELRKYTLVNIRLDKQGNVRMSKPCKVCQELLCVFNFKEVIYSTNEGKFDVLV